MKKKRIKKNLKRSLDSSSLAAPQNDRRDSSSLAAPQNDRSRSASLAASRKGRHRLLIEIGTEEIPANYLSYADKNNQEWFRQHWNQALEKINADGALEWGECQIECTPRRLVIWMPQIRFSGEVRKQPVCGPPLDRAYDAEGKPTAMLMGFVEAKKTSLEALGRFEVKGRVCVGFEESLRPEPLKNRLKEATGLFVRSLTYPKTMVWNESGLRYPRPIRWLLCLLDDAKIKLELPGLTADASTSIFSHGKRRRISVKSAERFFALLKKEGVVLSAQERRARLESDIRRLTQKAGGVYKPQEALLEEVVFLTERPAAFLGQFNPDFAQLPKEVLTSSLSKSQRLFSIRDKQQKHLPYYVMVLDGMPQKPADIIRTVTAILHAKLQDSRFFWTEDLKAFGAQGSGSSSAAATRLEGELGHLLYLKDAGSMAQKITRIREAGQAFAGEWGMPESERADFDAAARFCKVDLLTQMVGEFPELQGVMGGYYYSILTGGDPLNPVSAAIREHYKPVSAEDDSPRTQVGAALALLDKADLIAACFRLGKLPTASQDPYALKRSAQGIFKCAAAHRLKLRWGRLMEFFLTRFAASNAAGAKTSETLVKLSGFYLERLGSYFEQKGYPPTLIQAVISVNAENFLDAADRLEALSGLAESDSFVAAAKVFQRLSNILKSATPAETGEEVREDLFEKPDEGELYRAYLSTEGVFKDRVRKGAYREATILYAEAFNDILHGFFERVLVHAEDTRRRANRLSLLYRVRSLYLEAVADLSKIRPESATYSVSIKKS